MPTTRYNDLPKLVQTLFVTKNTEVSITLPGQCFGVTIGVGGDFKFTSPNFIKVRIALDSGIVASATGTYLTLYGGERATANIPAEQDRYMNYSKRILIPRNKFVRDLTIYGAIDQTFTSLPVSNTLALQAMYWTTPTP